jgi:excisionase family DNA binding protein
MGRGSASLISERFDPSGSVPKVTALKDHTGDSILAQIMTTRELAKYLRLHQITICKLSKEGKIPSIRIGRVWRFDKEVIDEWIAKG